LHPNSLDFVVFFLDDGFIAGGSEAVACFCSFLKEELSEIGLTLEFSKCEVVPAAGVRFAGARDMFGEFLGRIRATSNYSGRRSVLLNFATTIPGNERRR
jgi:hypothetical protein